MQNCSKATNYTLFKHLLEKEKYFDEDTNTLYIATTTNWSAPTTEVLEVSQSPLGTTIVDTPGIITLQFKGPDMENIQPLSNLQFTILAKQLHGANSNLRLVRLNESNEITNEAVYDIGIYTNVLTLRSTADGDFQIGQLYTFFWGGTTFVMSGFDYTSITSRLTALETHFTNVTNHLDIQNNNVYSAKSFETLLGFIGKSILLTNAGNKLLRFDDNGGYGSGAWDFKSADMEVKTFIPDQTNTYDSYPVPYLLFKNEVANEVDSAIATKIIIDTRTPTQYEADEGLLLPNGTIYIQKGTAV